MVLAGGSGQRFGAEQPKQLLLLAGKPVLHYSLQAFEQSAAVTDVVVVAQPAIRAEVERIATGSKVRAVVDGGLQRWESTRQGLAVVPDDANVLVHDAARPLMSQAVIENCAKALESYEAITVAVKAVDTIAATDAGGETIAAVLPRNSLRQVQTPQGFRVKLLREVHQNASADVDVTDDCGLVLKYRPDVKIGIVDGDSRAFKVTYPVDLEIAELLLRKGGENGDRA